MGHATAWWSPTAPEQTRPRAPRVAQELREVGMEAAALEGGFDAWRASFGVEPIRESAPA